MFKMKLLSYKLETIFKVHFQLNSRNKLQVSQMSQKKLFQPTLVFSQCNKFFSCCRKLQTSNQDKGLFKTQRVRVHDKNLNIYFRNKVYLHNEWSQFSERFRIVSRKYLEVDNSAEKLQLCWDFKYYLGKIKS